ncbi:MAG TPA: HEAT repeat domain-containing protein [Thermoanaerobaculia bacterium]|nr:HEAT repeat domain-containing protein [Thermoanaerobaculia bacterium]
MSHGIDDHIDHLIRRLGSDDAAEVRTAGEQLLRLGAQAAPALRQALAGATPNARKAAAFLLGKAGRDRASAEALLRALGDSEPKVRKNAAVALGQIGDESAAGPLSDALAAESFEWVRTSLILALGKIGGATARQALEALAATAAAGADSTASAVSGQGEAASPAEREALRKSLDRLSGPAADLAWRPGARLGLPVYAAVPPGFEDIAAEEMLEHGLSRPEPAGHGFLRLPGSEIPGGRLAALRCLLDLRLLLADVPAPLDPGGIPAALARALVGPLSTDGEGGLLARWRDWLETPDPVLRYRFSLDGIRVPKVVFLQTLAIARDALAPHGLADSPSSYAALLRVEIADGRLRIWLVPTFESSRRFAYREADVGAAIDPVVAACLARLIRTSRRGEAEGRSGGLVFDPTCGSATLLIERALLDEPNAPRSAGLPEPPQGLRLAGSDISPTAVRAAETNIAAAGLANRIRVRRADATEPAAWPLCREVLANLPFGWRSASQDRDLAGLYQGLVANLARALEPGGRALLYTASARLLVPVLARTPQLAVRNERTVESGGLKVGVWVLERAGEPARD